MEHIRQTLQGVIKGIETKHFSETSKIFRLFRKNLAAAERKHAKCIALRNGVLTVNVDSSVWLYQLSLKKETLLKKVSLKNIYFRIGEVK